MKASREHKVYMNRWWQHLGRCCWDDLAIFKFERDKKRRKTNRRARDGSHGSKSQYQEA